MPVGLLVYIVIILSFGVVLSRGTVHELQRSVPTLGRVLMTPMDRVLVSTYQEAVSQQPPVENTHTDISSQ